MTTVHAEPITHEHQALLEPLYELVTFARELPRLDTADRALRRDRLVAFVQDVVLPHAKAEERGLYQQVARVLGHPEATAPMVYDHLAVREWTSRLAEADVADADGLQQLLYGLHAIIAEHFRKEEELYEPLLARAEPETDPSYRDALVLQHES